MVVAHANGDEPEIRLLEQASPQLCYTVPDIALPLQKLNVMALVDVNVQLERAGNVLLALHMQRTEGDEHGMWSMIGSAAAYQFRIGKLAWEEFTSGIGIDGDALVRANYQGMLLDACSANICNMAPARDELQAVCDADVKTCVADLVDGWRHCQNGMIGKAA